MSKFACTCGIVLNLSGAWPECEWRPAPMARVDEIAGAKGSNLFNSVVTDVLLYH
jgi:hypothetical protein